MRPVWERLAARSFLPPGWKRRLYGWQGCPPLRGATADFGPEASKNRQVAKTIFKSGLRHNASVSLKHWDFPGFGKISHGLFTRPQISPMFMRVS